MTDLRVTDHPVLPIDGREAVLIQWQGRALPARAGETIAATLHAAGIVSFGPHSRDGSPQGLFCANGQCAQCLVLAGGTPVKACMHPVSPGLEVEPLHGPPRLPAVQGPPVIGEECREEVPVLIIGGGPAGLAAAATLGQLGIEVLLVDDQPHLGGKLLLQTHRFFGARETVHAGTRGIDIATTLESEARSAPATRFWLASPAIGVFSDRWVGILKNGTEYVLVRPKVLINAAGAREKQLVFPGSTLPGVLGAGAFQTLLNRDLIRFGHRLFVIGGGNVGLIAAYHAIQGGLSVAGLAELLPTCGGYRVHRDKLARLGVPIFESHTILSANGHSRVESVTIARVNERQAALPGTERTFACDTVLIAVGLDPIGEFTSKAGEAGISVLAAGDADEIAEASAAIMAGRIRALEAARRLGHEAPEAPPEWRDLDRVLRAHPGGTVRGAAPAETGGVQPVIHCHQQIPCDPCAAICPRDLIAIDPGDIRDVPRYTGGECLGCLKCVAVCPGLAITLVDRRRDVEHPLITLAYELPREAVAVGQVVITLDEKGRPLGSAQVVAALSGKGLDRTTLVRIRAPRADALRIAGIRPEAIRPAVEEIRPPLAPSGEVVVCRCERVRARDLATAIREGCHDADEIKALTRAGMGACGGRTCGAEVTRILAAHGVRARARQPWTIRPPYREVALGVFAAGREAADDAP
jgi:NADPH-dependent 2,4-dienoyl-CoA reductase/sulfur reductase-like enzyme/Fe-S-cluster-containing hydrogenase component 2/bacterioferritin-associated ferredoxin